MREKAVKEMARSSRLLRLLVLGAALHTRRRSRLQAHSAVSHKQIRPPPHAPLPNLPKARGEPDRRIWHQRHWMAGPSRSGRRTCSSRRATPSSGRNVSALPSTRTLGGEKDRLPTDGSREITDMRIVLNVPIHNIVSALSRSNRRIGCTSRPRTTTYYERNKVLGRRRDAPLGPVLRPSKQRQRTTAKSIKPTDQAKED